MEIASQWLMDCTENHKKTCPGATRSNTFLPTRLIDVGKWGANVDPHLHFTDGNERSPVPSYVTLSHCWGPNVIPRLLLDNLDDRRNRIEISTLPRMFQDAITSTQKMGIQYLWIDSLCIIQDSEQDWLSEPALVGNGYANSYCNIAATAAKDGTVGCFFKRDPRLVHPLKLEVSWGGLRPGSYYAINNSV